MSCWGADRHIACIPASAGLLMKAMVAYVCTLSSLGAEFVLVEAHKQFTVAGVLLVVPVPHCPSNAYGMHLLLPAGHSGMPGMTLRSVMAMRTPSGRCCASRGMPDALPVLFISHDAPS